MEYNSGETVPVEVVCEDVPNPSFHRGGQFKLLPWQPSPHPTLYSV